MRKQIGVFTVLSCSLFSMSGFAADIYVSFDNAKATDASSNKGIDPNVPLKTIQRAALLATAGTTVHVAAGTYNVSAPALGSAGITSKINGSASAHIRFTSDPKNRAKIVVSGTGVAWDSQGSYVDIDGFEITGSGRIGILAEGAHLNITNNYIHDLTISGGCNGSGGAAIDTPNTVGDVHISGNLIRNIGTAMMGSCNSVQGIYIIGPNNVVTNNVVSGVSASAIQQWHTATASAIINNTVFHNNSGIVIGNNELQNGSENNYVANNIAYDNLADGIGEFGKAGANNRYITNLVYRNKTNIKVTGAQSGNIIADPAFINYQANGSGNYRLQASSPAINKGTATSAPLTDFDGKPRQGAVDMGAYEYQGSAPASSVNPPEFATSYSVLKTYSANCDGRAALSLDCNAAVDGFCRAKGYQAGGFGPVEHAGDVAYVVCVHTGQAARFSTSFTALHGYNSYCNSSVPMSVECSSAINRFCRNGNNYAAGGFGPLQVSGDNVTLSCVTSSEADYRSDSWATLKSYQSGCNGQATAPTDVCKAAVQRRCQALTYGSGSKYVGGYGILEMNSSTAYFSCLRY